MNWKEGPEQRPGPQVTLSSRTWKASIWLLLPNCFSPESHLTWNLSSQGPVLTRLASQTPTGWEGTHWVHYCMSQELPSPGSLDCAHFRSSSNQPELEVATPFTYLAHNQPPFHCTLCATPRSVVLNQGWICPLMDTWQYQEPFLFRHKGGEHGFLVPSG